ncbi:hypothetical protein [Actinocrispum wychmicini]|uniref:Uncharacterized protein n=1 Tax=Actinocrispum wychmicini TaxID=1213861 RepID=A0A4R2JF95_9PSEU|nr:hypothetical protein [Actinocrispum wychmicini]TCO54929.1 hypothetical protein EV192_108217 [Actinocrispum wychmicini]
MRKAIVGLAITLLAAMLPAVASAGLSCRPTVDIGDVAQVEGSVFRFPVTFRILPACPALEPGSVGFHTVDGSPGDHDPARAGVDYGARSGVLKWPGPATQYIEVPTFGNTVPQHTRVFWVQLDTPNNVSVSHGEAAGWIQDDDGRPPPQTDCQKVPCQGTVPASGICWIPDDIREVLADFHFSYQDGPPREVHVRTDESGGNEGWVPIRDQVIKVDGDQLRATVRIQLTANRRMTVPLQFFGLARGVDAGNMTTKLTVMTTR